MPTNYAQGAGAVAGTAILGPGLGTFVGGALGGLLGSVGGHYNGPPAAQGFTSWWNAGHIDYLMMVATTRVGPHWSQPDRYWYTIYAQSDADACRQLLLSQGIPITPPPFTIADVPTQIQGAILPAVQAMMNYGQWDQLQRIVDTGSGPAWDNDQPGKTKTWDASMRQWVAALLAMRAINSAVTNFQPAMVSAPDTTTTVNPSSLFSQPGKTVSGGTGTTASRTPTGQPVQEQTAPSKTGLVILLALGLVGALAFVVRR